MKNILHLQGLGCGGDSISLLNAEEPDFPTALKMMELEVAWHPSLSLAQGDEVAAICRGLAEGRQPLDFLVIEGAVPTGPDGSGTIYEFAGRPFLDWVRDLAGIAAYTLAIGTCAATGGIPAAAPNPAGAMGLQFSGKRPGGILGEAYRSRAGLPVINIPGCPPHPDWMLATLHLLCAGKLDREDLDYANRPSPFFGSLAHHGCPKNEFYEFKASAEELGQLGCLFEKLGCRGTQCESDCNIRLWLGRTGSCTRAGYPCIACTSQDFPPESTRFFQTESIGRVPKFLPRDVPKAWYIGMVGLSKMATPERVRNGAVATNLGRNRKPVGKKEEE